MLTMCDRNDHALSEGHRHDRRQTSPENRRSAADQYRNSLQAKGLERLTVVVGVDTAQRLRNLSSDHNESMARVIELGVKIAQRELAAMDARRRQGGQ